MPRSRTWTGCGAVLYASPAPDEGLTPVTGGEARLEDPRVTIAALLVAHGCGVGHTPVIGAADPLKYGRLSHVGQTCLRPATHRAAGATLIGYQASTSLAQAWDGGFVAFVRPQGGGRRRAGDRACLAAVIFVAPRGQGLRLRPPAPMAEQERHPPPPGRRKDSVLAGRMPTPAPPP